MKKHILMLCTLPLYLFAADIYMAGDSTMANYGEKYFPMWGWGMAMENLCVDGVKVHNRAVGGRSAKSFISEKRWEKIMKEAKKGDFVIIQFGHNDATRNEKDFYRSTYPESTYQYYLHIYIAEARAKGVIPVLCTQTLLCEFDKSGKLTNRGRINKKYVEACRKVAKETGCDFIDLNLCVLEKFSAMSREEVEKNYMVVKPGEYPNYPAGKNDRCHLHKNGAEFYAKAFVEQAKKQNLPIAKLFK